MKVGKGKRGIYFKKATVDSSSVQRYGQPTAVTVPVEQSTIGCSLRGKQFKTEVFDLAFDNSSCRGCSLSARIRSAKSEDALI